jgi:hypothetical protein
MFSFQFLVSGSRLRYPLPEIRDEVPKNFSKGLNSLTADYPLSCKASAEQGGVAGSE